MPPRVPPPRCEDFGAPVLDPAPAGPAIGVRAVDAPPWLAGTEIHYRLLTDQPNRLRAYAEHRWIASPAELLAENLRERLPEGGPRRTLRIRLLRFEQDFEGAEHAQAIIELQATLRNAAGQWIASRRFDLSLPTTPDVQGAVAGLAAAARRTSATVIAWAQAAP